MEILQEGDLYSVPMRHEAKLNKAFYLSFGAALSAVMGLIVLNHLLDGQILIDLVFAAVVLPMGLFWLAVLVQKPYLELRDNRLHFKALFGGYKIIPLKNIEQVMTVKESGVRSLRIWSQGQGKDDNRRAADLMAGRGWDVIIAFYMFSTVDFHKLCRTIVSKMES
ncbi:hypothetical protein GZH47_30570 [Paenibacillus rhizovicinus]|uniref:Uncharacterized protein n=1 Tax=Paenibacillus rhizovicinus TaxID=2704463 RepID=A0A6C0PCJ6_9BACL|nr:hypothetical protein [Paenibacillus rhizovicinus]QHW34712.1 hypothetical protein GZH47_30570 [Paenibacillus rhizovicinus]